MFLPLLLVLGGVFGSDRDHCPGKLPNVLKDQRGNLTITFHTRLTMFTLCVIIISETPHSF